MEICVTPQIWCSPIETFWCWETTCESGDEHNLAYYPAFAETEKLDQAEETSHATYNSQLQQTI